MGDRRFTVTLASCSVRFSADLASTLPVVSALPIAFCPFWTWLAASSASIRLLLALDMVEQDVV